MSDRLRAEAAARERYSDALALSEARKEIQAPRAAVERLERLVEMLRGLA